MSTTFGVPRALSAGTAALLRLALLASPTPALSAPAAPGTTTADAGHHPDRRDGQHLSKKVRRVVLVGNNWDGTADILRPKRFKRLGRINGVPDRDERISEIAMNPNRHA